MNDQQQYKKNIKRYAAFSASFADCIEAASMENYHWCFTHLGELNFFIEHEGRRLYYHSMDGAIDEVRTSMKQIRLESMGLLFLFGIGAGYHYQHLKKWLREHPERRLVIIDDNTAALKMFFHTQIAEEMLEDPQVFLIPLKKEVYNECIKAIESFARSEIAKRSYFVLLPLYGKWQKRQCLLLRDMLFTALFWSVSLQGERVFGNLEVERNTFSNIVDYDQTFSLFPMKDSFKDVPLVIVGGGPSSAAFIEKNKEWMEKKLVITAGSGLNVCNYRGIESHFAAALDPTDSQATRLFSARGYNTSLIFRSRLNRRGYREHHGPKISFDGMGNFEPTHFIFRQLEGRDYREQAGISSVTFVLEIAEWLGCKEIYLLGVDLAYTKGARYPEGTFHHPCDSTEHEESISSLRKDIIYGENYLGDQIITRKDWSVEAEVIEEYAKKEGISLYNLSSEGLKMTKVPFVSKIEERKTESFDIEGRVQALQLVQMAEEKERKKMELILEEYRQKLDEYLETITPLFEEGENQTGKMCPQVWEDLLVKEKELVKKLKEEELFTDLLFYLRLQVERVQDSGKKMLQRFSENFSPEEKAQLSFFVEQVELKELHALCQRLKEMILFYQKRLEKKKNLWIGVEKRENLWEKQLPQSFWKEGILQITSLTGKVHKEAFSVERSLVYSQEEPLDSAALQGKVAVEQALGQGLTHRFTLKQGRFHGPSRFYYKDTLLVQSWYWEGKKEGTFTSYYPTGEIRERTEYVKGKKEGESVVFYQNGILSSYLLYEKGVFSGVCRLYYPSGRVKRILPFLRGHLHGEELGFYEEGGRKFLASWQEGKPKGACFYYHPQGVLMRKNVFGEGGMLLSSVEYTVEGKESIKIKEELGEEREQIKRKQIEKELKKLQEELAFLQGPRGPENELFIF